MKSILFLIALLIGFYGETTSLKNKVDKTEITSLPFEITNLTKYPTPLYAVNSELASEISLHAYSDVNLKKRIKYDDTNCTIFRRFNTEGKNYILLDLAIEIGENERHLLATSNSNYQIIDTSDVAVGGSFDNFTFTKQYRLDSDFKVTVYWLKPLSETPVYFRPDTPPFEAQRIDCHYHIDDNGKFIQDEEILYKPQIYKPQEISVDGKNIWGGKEEKINR